MFDYDRLVTDKIGTFIKGRLLQNKEIVEKNGEFISCDEAYRSLEELREASNFCSGVEYTEEYNELAEKCAGRVNFTSQEIDEIVELIQKSIQMYGVEKCTTYWDIISFPVKSLDKLIHNENSAYIGELDHDKLLKYRDCLKLDYMPLFYKTFACIIACNYPNCLLRITNVDNETIYSVDGDGQVVVDDLVSDVIFDNENLNIFKNEDNDEAVKIAVDWWSQAITDPSFVLRFDPNASYISSILALFNSMHRVVPSEEAVRVFKESLGNEIKNALIADGHYTISTNYNFDPVLRDALNKANFCDVDYSWKTRMDISPDEVSVTLGSGSKQVIFDSKDKTAFSGVQKVKI